MTELSFSEEMQAQIDAITKTTRPDDASSTTVKFDAKGTLHNRSYNRDGKLLQDVPLKERTIDEAMVTGAIRAEDIQHELNQSHIRNRRSQILYACVIIILGALLCMSVVMVRMIGGIYGG